jgi:hypothetical protein
LSRGDRREASTRAGGQGPRSRAPAEAAIALAMDMVAVVGNLGVDVLLREGIEVNGLRSTPGFQHGIKPLPRPLEQAAEPMDGDPVKGRTQAVGGGLELLPEDLRGQEPCQLLVLVEPAAQGVAHGRVAGGWTASMGRLPISQAVKALDQGVGQADADDARVLRFFMWHGFPLVDAKHYIM